MYEITSGNVSYYTTLSYKIETVSVLRVLNVEIAWWHDYRLGTVSATDQSVKLTTYSGS